ncbi:hypothetical protein [Rhizobium sp. TRM95796]|uniref:hypothetical protein n=1 Tax=Rhizobium sp. TRM95796 TaxID=2979862 RepID=UPI0021E73652|nr:hypothetical protein [Rhizobium sp. TRM95796]MCV3769015.1 hypothetical protein [Rhizobium sp. TRM95796]
MLLQKYRENKEALMQIGKEALAESRRLGLPLSAKDLENERKDRAEREHEERVPAAMRQ